MRLSSAYFYCVYAKICSMNANSANLDGQNTVSDEEELDFNSADIVAQDTASLFVNVDGVEQPTAPEKEKPAPVAEPKERKSPKLNPKIIKIAIICVVSLAVLAGAAFVIYRIINHDEIEAAEIAEESRDYGARLNEIVRAYRNTSDYDAAMSRIEQDINDAPDEKTKIMAQNNKLKFLSYFSSNPQEVYDYRASYCDEATQQKYPGASLCGDADETMKTYKAIQEK